MPTPAGLELSNLNEELDLFHVFLHPGPSVLIAAFLPENVRLFVLLIFKAPFRSMHQLLRGCLRSWSSHNLWS